MTYYVSIGNSDNKLTQVDWSLFQTSVLRVIQTYAEQIHGVWYSAPTSAFQNMCIGYEVYEKDRQNKIRSELRQLAYAHKQDSIALAKAETEFIKGE